GSSLKIEER
nr:caldesmon=phosphorylation site [rabbits, skeletal myosin, Peptide Partial, 9 aa] [Oryctolagus cuniculus]